MCYPGILLATAVLSKFINARGKGCTHYKVVGSQNISNKHRRSRLLKYLQ